MKNSVYVKAAVMAALFASAAGVAEPGTGSRIDLARKSVKSSDIEGENAASRVMNKFARCVADRRPRQAAALLELPYLGPEQSKGVIGLVKAEDPCLGIGDHALRFKPPALVGGLAEQLVLSRQKEADLSLLKGMSDEAMLAAGLGPRNVAEDFGQCVARRDPMTALQLIKSEPASAAESQIVKVLAPNLGPCLVEGQSLALNARSVRAIVAVGLYRMIAKPRAGAGS